MLTIVNRLFADLGPSTILQLTSSFLQGWNRQQTIGCPVRVAAGTYVKLPHLGWLLPRYYNPSDGIVGQASALAEASVSLDGTKIPAPGISHVIQIGSFPVVHSSTLSFLGTTNTLTNDAAVGAAVLSAVKAGLSGSACFAPGLGAFRAPRHASVRVRRSFIALGALKTRTVRARRGELALLLRGASVRCRGRRLPSVPLLGSRRVRLVALRCSGPLRVRGEVLLLGRDPQRRTLLVVRRGRSLRVRIAGPRLRRLDVQVELRGSWRPVHRRAIRLPATAGTVTVRATGADANGVRVAATAVVAR